MADNVAQSIKDLQKRLETLDTQLLREIDASQKLGQMIKDSMQTAGVSVDDFIKKIQGISGGAQKARAIRLALELTDQKGNPLTAQTLQKEVDKVKTLIDSRGFGTKSTIDIFGTKFTGSDAIKKRYDELLRMQKMMGDSAKLYDDLMKILNQTGNKKEYSESATQRALNQKEVRNLGNRTVQLKSLNGEQIKNNELLAKRNELERKISEMEKSGKTKGLNKLKSQWEEVNKYIQEYLAKLSGLDKAGERALKGFRQMGLLGRGDDAMLEMEKQRIQLIKERNKLEEQSTRLRQNMATRQMAGTLTIPYTQRTNDQIEKNDRRILEIERQIAGQKIQLTDTTNKQIEQLELAHQNNMTNIRNQGEQARRQIEQQKAVQAIFDRNKREEEIERERRQQRVNESKSAYKEEARILQDAAAARIADEKRSTEMINREQARRKQQQQEYTKALVSQQKNFMELNRLLIARKKLQAQIDSQPRGATNAQEMQMRRLNVQIDNTVQSMRNLNAQYKGLTAQASRDTMNQRLLQTNNAIMQMGRSINGVHRNLMEMMSTVQRLAYAFGVTFSLRGLAQFGKKLIETRGQFEMQFVAMKQIIGDVDAATKIWNQTMQQALQSPFKAMQLVDYTKKLAAYRVENEKLFDTTKRLADVSAGLGVDMGRLILAYGQVKTANYLRASEVRQFTEAGVNIYGELAKYFSEIEGRAVSTADVVERVTKRMVLFSDVEEIFKRMTDEGGTFYDMQAVQADTVRGQIMKLHDAYDQMLNTIGESKQGTLRNLIDTLNDLVRNWRDVGAAMKLNIGIITPLFAWFKILKPMISSLVFALSGGTKAILGFNTALKIGSINLKTYSTSMKYTIASASGMSKVAKVLTLRIGQLRAAFSAFGKIPQFALITGALLLTEKLIFAITGGIGNLDRAVRQLHKDLQETTSKGIGDFKTESDGYKDLVAKLENANEGSEERRQIISKLNSQYGQYLDFVVDETTKTEDLANAYEKVTQRMKEAAKSKILEEGYQQIQKTYFDVRKSAIDELRGVSIASSQLLSAIIPGISTKIAKNEVDEVANYIEKKLGELSEEEIKLLDNEEKRVEFARKIIAEFFDVEENVIMDADKAVGLIDAYIKQQEESVNLEKQISEQLESQNRTRKQINAFKALEVEYAKELKDIESGNYSENEVKYLKEKAAARFEENKIQLRLELGEISEEEAKRLQSNLQNKLLKIAQQVNERLKVYVARQFNFGKDFDEYIEENIGKNLPEIDNAIALYNRLRTEESDIAQGISQFEKSINGDLENQLSSVREILKHKQLGLDVDEEDLQKQILLLQNLEKQAELWGIKPKNASVNWINAQTFADIQSKFAEKYRGPRQTTVRGLLLEDQTKTQVELADEYNKKADEQKKIVDALNKSKAEGVTIDETALAIATANEQAYRDLASWLGYIEKQRQSGGGGEKVTVDKMIKVVENMHNEFNKLSKEAYGFAKSAGKVEESYAKAVSEILKGTGVNIDNIKYQTKEELADTLDKLAEYVRKNKAKFEKNAYEMILRRAAEARVKVDIELTTRTRENVAKQLEEAFGDYQLTLDLQKLQLPSGLLTDMFDIDAVDLAGMRQKLEELSAKLVDENGVMTGDNLKLYEQWLKKLDDEERKLQQQRLKDYSKYLEYQLSDRAKIEMEYVKKVAEVQSELAFDDTTRGRILEGLRKERDEKLAKQDWEDFKGSEMYIEMMEDLTKQGTAALEEMRKKLLEVRDNAENLSPRALKEVIRALEKIDETVYGRMSPFQAVGELRKKTKGAMNQYGIFDISEAFERDRAAKEEYEERRKLHEAIEENIADRQKEADLEEQIGERGSRNIDALREYLEIAREQKKAAEEYRDLLGEENKENQEEYQKTLHEIQNWSIQIEQYQKRINLLTKLQSIQDKIAKSEYSDISLEDLTKMSKEELAAMNAAEEEMKAMEEIKKDWKLLNDAEIKALDEAKNYLSIIQGIAKNTSEMLTTLGVEQNPLREYWSQAADAAFSYAQETIDAIKQFKEAANAATAAGEALATGNYIKLALQLLGVLVQIINQIGLFRGARINRDIERAQERIDNLSLAYERLEKSIEKTLSTAEYIADYNKQIRNTYAQIAAVRMQLSAAQARKNQDQSEINGYRSTLADLNDQLEDLQNQMQETFGGIGGRGNYRSWAEGFVSEWRSAFLETGDGLDALEDHFNEFLQSWFEKQATMRIAAKMLDPLMTMIDQSVDDGILTRMELDRVRERAAEIFPELNEQLREFFNTMGFGDGTGSLSGLAQAMGSMTEQQADILASYANSLRLHTASIDVNVAAIANALGIGNGVENNPMLAQLSIVARNTSNMNRLFESVVKPGHPLHGSGIRVWVN